MHCTCIHIRTYMYMYFRGMEGRREGGREGGREGWMEESREVHTIPPWPIITAEIFKSTLVNVRSTFG